MSTRSNVLWAICCLLCCVCCFFVGNNSATIDCSDCPTPSSMEESAYVMSPRPGTMSLSDIDNIPSEMMSMWVSRNCSIICCENTNYVCIGDPSSDDCEYIPCTIESTCENSLNHGIRECTRLSPLLE